MDDQFIEVEVWLYGSLKRYGGEAAQVAHAQLNVRLPVGAKMGHLLAQLGMPVAEKGMTFVNSQLTDMPGLLSDLDRELADGDRIGLFSPKTMWPFQYRFGASMSPKLEEDMKRRGAMRHSFQSESQSESG